MTYVSVGHRATLKRFHTQLLQLAPQQAQAPANGSSTSDSHGASTSATMTWQLMPTGAEAAKA